MADRRQIKPNGNHAGPTTIIPTSELEEMKQYTGQLVAIIHHIALFKGEGELRLPYNQLKRFNPTCHGIDIAQSEDMPNIIRVRTTGKRTLE